MQYLLTEAEYKELQTSKELFDKQVEERTKDYVNRKMTEFIGNFNNVVRHHFPVDNDGKIKPFVTDLQREINRLVTEVREHE